MHLYTVEFNAQDLAAADGNMDMFELRPSSSLGWGIRLLGLSIHNTTDLGDAQAEGQYWSLLRMTGGTFTSGTGGTTPTPVPLEHGDVAASFGADAVNDSVATTTGTAVTLFSDALNVNEGLDLPVLPPEWRANVGGIANAALIVRFNTTVLDTITWHGWALVGEGP